MGRLRALFNIIFGRLFTGSRKSFRPVDSLSPEALARAMHEARYLSGAGVDVQSLAPGEVPSLPKEAAAESSWAQPSPAPGAADTAP